jgi:hypothetical protein
MTMLHQRQAFTCPCCGGFIGEAAPIEDVIAALTGHKQSLVKAIAKARGMRADRAALIEAMWRGAREPTEAVSTFNVMIYRTRIAVEEFGWALLSPGRGGDDGVYRLVPKEAGAC